MPSETYFSDVIVCGPDGFRLQGKCAVSGSSIVVGGHENRLQIRCGEVDRLILIPPLQPTVSTKTGAHVGIQRRFGTSVMPPPNWYTLGIATKDFLYFEFSLPSRDEQDLFHKSLSEFIKMPVMEMEPFYPSTKIVDGWEAFSPKEDFEKEIASGVLRLSSVNENFRVCSTYPELVVVPASVDDEVIAEAALGRRGCRFPVIKYFHSAKSTILATAAEFSGKVSDLSQRCRANEKLLEAMLPPGGRGLIIDLRSDSKGNDSSSVSSKSKKIEKKRNRNLSSIIEANVPKNARKPWSSVLFVRGSSTDQFDQRWKRIDKPLPEIGEIFSIFSQFIRDITRSTEIAPQQASSTSSSSAAGYKLSSFLPSSNSDFSSAARSSANTPLCDDVDDGNGAFAGVKVSLKKTSGWLGLVRDGLAAAVAGACALDGRDLAARSQLERDRALLLRSVSGSPDAQMQARLAAMTPSGASLLVVGGEGRDRCLLVSALIQVILSPAVRTIRGFQALVQRDWISAGHAFSRRCSNLLQQSESGPVVAAPTFLLFLDCIWQIWCQYPSSFEFNEELLLLLVKHSYFSEFGTFLGDCDEMKKTFKVPQNTISLWTYINSPQVLPKIKNCLYSPPKDDADPECTYCWPCLSPQALSIWREVYQRVLLPYPCRIWSNQRETLARVYSEYNEALSEAQGLERVVRVLMEEASERNLLPVK